MMHHLALAATLLAPSAAPTPAPTLRGSYVEARNCDVWTGPCFANADVNLTGKFAVMAWRIDQGSVDGVKLDGLGVVAVVVANNTLGWQQSSPAKTLLLVDKQANASQKDALIRLAKQQGGKLLSNVVAVQASDVQLVACECKNDACYELTAGKATIKTRCLDAGHDKICGNETAFYPPLAQSVDVRPAGVVEHAFRGSGLGQTWTDTERRGAYVGTFAVR